MRLLETFHDLGLLRLRLAGLSRCDACCRARDLCAAACQRAQQGAGRGGESDWTEAFASVHGGLLKHGLSGKGSAWLVMAGFTGPQAASRPVGRLIKFAALQQTRRKLKGNPMRLVVRGIPTQHAEHLRTGGFDANGHPAVVKTAEGKANPCRHCLQLIAKGGDTLVLSYRPFPEPQPYAESGPIFLHKSACIRYDAEVLPAWFAYLTPAIIRSYGHDDWIKYETGDVVAGSELTAATSEDPVRRRCGIRSHQVEVQLFPVPC